MIASVLGAFAAILIIGLFLLRGNRERSHQSKKTEDTIPWNYYVRTLLVLGLVASLNHMVLIIIQFAVTFTLIPGLMDYGFSQLEAMEAKGVFDRGQPLIQLGTVLGSSFALALLPSVTKDKLRKSPDTFYAYIQGALLFSFYLAIGATIVERVNVVNHKKIKKDWSINKNRNKPEVTFESIIGESEKLMACKSLARRAARTTATVLITGESGTGKEVFARAIHNLSPCADGPFVSLNCAAIPEHLLEAELFGYEEGAFTGARKGGKPGKFEMANNGTLLLDEIGDMPLHMQAKILRVLQEREFERVGGSRGTSFKVRVIAATNHNLEKMVADGLFREDLFYRLNIIKL